MKIVKNMVDTLREMDLERLDVVEDVIYALEPELTIGYFNDAWVKSGIENGPPGFLEKWGLGCSVLDAAETEVQRAFYEHRIQSDVGPVGWSHLYQCHTPDRFRIFRSHTIALPDQRGYFVTHTLVESRPHGEPDRVPEELAPGDYRNADGMLVQCAECRRTQTSDGAAWHWIPAFLDPAISGVSHGLCSPCAGVYLAL